MKKAILQDNRTGELLEFTYDPASSSYTINDVTVLRQFPLEDKDDEVVFAPASQGMNKLYHVRLQDLQQLL